jgi:lysophospholipase L1-like esterase
MSGVAATKKLRIVGLGDSTTAGTPAFLSPLEAPPDGRGDLESQYEFWMMKLHPEWAILNRGINGERSDQVRARVQRDVIDAKPDYAIILAGVNDVYQGFPTDHTKQNLTLIYNSTLLKGIVTIAAAILPYNTMSSQAYGSIKRLNEWIRSTAESMKFPFCDTYAAVVDPDHPDKLRSSPDGLHPDVSGYRSMGEALVRTIEQNPPCLD